MRTIPVHKSLTRRMLLLGAEYDLVFILAFISFLLVLGGQSKISLLTALVFWFVSLPFLQKIAKADPYMSEVFKRYIKQKAFYPAHSHPFRGNI